MSYYSLFGLTRDPFVTTPDPDLFFRCPRQVDHLDRLEIGVRLKRGLSVVLGPVGTGKSTLSRQLMRVLAADAQFSVHLLLDPLFDSEKEFLTWLNREFDVPPELIPDSVWQLKDTLKNRLFEIGVDQARTATLIIDEGQKIPRGCLELLRELLNYETNDFKLLQIVIFAQEEFKDILAAMPNLADRVYQTLTLGPFSLAETRALIQTRLGLCAGEGAAPSLFSREAYLAVYWATRGYPRQIVQLCHKAMLAALAADRRTAGWSLVWASTDRGRSPLSPLKLGWASLTVLGLAAGFWLAENEALRRLVTDLLQLGAPTPGG